jgi:phage baseplate assembly protein W
MDGTDAATGKKLGGIAHLRQSVTDILTTPIGTRVMRRAYGSRLFELIDAPMNRQTLLDIIAAAAEAIKKWEPRYLVKKVLVQSAAPGALALDLFGTYLPDGKEVTLDGIVVKAS